MALPSRPTAPQTARGRLERRPSIGQRHYIDPGTPANEYASPDALTPGVYQRYLGDHNVEEAVPPATAPTGRSGTARRPAAVPPLALDSLPASYPRLHTAPAGKNMSLRVGIVLGYMRKARSLSEVLIWWAFFKVFNSMCFRRAAAGRAFWSRLGFCSRMVTRAGVLTFCCILFSVFRLTEGLPVDGVMPDSSGTLHFMQMTLLVCTFKRCFECLD